MKDETGEIEDGEVKDETGENEDGEVKDETGEIEDVEIKDEIEDETEIESKKDEIKVNTGSAECSIVTKEAFEKGFGDDYYAEDGSYVINLSETNPYFPYEVQFVYKGETTEYWFMDPTDSVEIAGHKFTVSAYFDYTAVTQLSLNVAGDKVVVYPAKKEFTNGDGAMEVSMLPLEERSLSVNLSGYTPAELTMVSVESIFIGDHKLEDTSKIVWTTKGGDNYTISSSGEKLDLSYNTYYGYSHMWEMIVGEADQLAIENIRYMVEVQTTQSTSWLTPVVCVEDEDNKRKQCEINLATYSDYRNDVARQRELRVNVTSPEEGYVRDGYLSLKVNEDLFWNHKYSSIRFFEGNYTKAEDALAAKEITEQICCNDMESKGKGYPVKISYSNNQWITVVTFDENGAITGCLPVSLFVYYGSVSSSTTETDMYFSLYKKTAAGIKSVSFDGSSSTKWYNSDKNGVKKIVLDLYKGYAADQEYIIRMSESYNNRVTAAYEGNYNSIEKAEAAGAKNIKDVLFDSEGEYSKNFSKGVYFTIFTEKENSENSKVTKICFITNETEDEKPIYSHGASLWFYGFNDADGNRIDAYMVDADEDSYGECNYLTVLVPENVDLTNLAPVFTTSQDAKLYVAGSSSPEVSGESYHDFSKGMIQYTTSSEDGDNTKNYWVQVVKPESGVEKIYINSLNAAEAKTQTKAGIIYSEREIMIDTYHNDVHDILFANIGTEEIPMLGVELDSDTLELDSYWTFKGANSLLGFSTVDSSVTQYGELPNLGKIRLTAKDGIQSGEVSGTLTIKSGDRNLMVLELTGQVGDPTIITTEIPDAVKYVPYGTMIQNNNKYSWNKVVYKLYNGKLPEGMVLKANGELYGVPKETGTFRFEVCLVNQYTAFGRVYKQFTLNVLENTDQNVDAATDEGYTLSQRVQDISVDSGDSKTQTLVSEGVLTEFVDIYLDGEKLEEGKDYTAVSGSTRITIRNSTLAVAYNGDSNAVHTLGMEFRTSEKQILKRAAQNFKISKNEENSSAGNGGSSNNTSGIGNIGSTSENGNMSNNVSETFSSGNGQYITGNRENILTTYTVQSGDTLWKIAVKFFGNGNEWRKIYEANKDILSSPDRIYAGQILKIGMSAINTTISSITITSNENGTTTYVVKKDDSLWKISRMLYGKGNLWMRIYEANREKIKSPNRIYAGQKFLIP